MDGEWRAKSGDAEDSASAKLKVLISQEAVFGGFSSLTLHSKPPFLRQEQIYDNNREMYSFPAEAAIMPHVNSRNIFKLDGHGGKHTEHRPPLNYHQWNSAHTLHAVAEDRPLEETIDDIENDSISSSTSFSSLTDTCFGTSSSSLSSESSQNSADVEAAMETQSLSKGDLDAVPCFVAGSPPFTRKGLSKFYAGKSRSFSCVRDVVSVKELAKPENPYAKRIKQHKYHNLEANRQRILPAQKGSALISKKSANVGKTSLALAMAMSIKTTEYHQNFSHEDDLQASSLPPRSFSFSDLHIRGEQYF